MKERIYVCHTYYHVYVACLKELNLPKERRGEADIVLSTMSNDFGDLKRRAERSGLFRFVFMFEEKEDVYFPELMKYHINKGNLLLNMISRIKYTKLLGKLQQPYVPVDFKLYKDIYVFCDSDPIGYYLSYRKIKYHALEDGLDCISTYDTARYDNRGHFKLKAFLASLNLIFIQNGWAKYCIDMEVNDISILPYPCPKYIEKSRAELVAALDEEGKDILIHLFIADMDEIQRKLREGGQNKVLILTEPLCDLEVRKKLFCDVIEQYGKTCGDNPVILIKPHPRDVLDYEKLFSQYIVLDGKFPMEVLNFIPDLKFKRVVSVFTVPSSIQFAEEIVYLGEDFMDHYEPPEMHRQNEMI
ncbi:glycosyltransferase family 52 [Kineothrix sp. MB12-C1]|uniref:glycosyltransferase family 52 n=1 Tax=Kineothrix sp. MB12-C1 TaxID=3070215 RepID=UPI0027D1F4B3|nr:glycosyltransferase family 52 [Kineothrix sp. MB12-C1]WMC91636.1 glycosyltransferase family 52 [Kineothrix sp. MB12-C1]